MADPVSLAITVGLTAAQMALTATRKIEGPRQDTRFTSGDYNAPLHRVYGLRRISPPIFWSEDLREVYRESKTKGGKFNSYTYYGTWAVMLADHEIERITRVWLDTHLAFDLTGAGPVTPFDFGEGVKEPFRTIAPTVSGKQTSYFAIYTGTEDQEPDARILATTEDRQGEGTCPAYRGRAYIVFKEVPLEKLGNRIPQVSVELVAHGAADSIPTQTVAQPVITEFDMAVYSTDFSRLLMIDWTTGYSPFEIWDVAARAPIIWGNLPVQMPWLGGSIGMYSDGSFLLVTGAGGDQKLFKLAPDASSAIEIASYPDGAWFGQSGVRVLRDGNGYEHYVTFSGSSKFYVDGAPLTYGPCRHAFADVYGDIWGVIPEGYTTTFVRLIAGGNTQGWADSIVVPHATSYSDQIYAAHVHTATGDQFVFGPRYEGGTYYNYVVDPVTGTATAVPISSAAGSAPYQANIWDNLVPGAASYWLKGNEISLVTGEVIRTPITLPLNAHTVYDPISHAVVEDTGGGLKWHYLDRVSGEGIPLANIVTDACAAAGLDAGEIDVSLLTATVPGYSVSQGSAKDWLEPLLSLYDIDARPHGFKLQFVPRGTTPTVTLSSDDFAVPDGGNAAALYSFARAGGSDAPASVALQFADLAADQQAASAMSGPLTTLDGKRDLPLDMSTLALSTNTARQLAGRYHRRQLMDRVPYTLALTAQQIALEPGDVRTLQLRGGTVKARLTSMVLGADRRIATEWRRDDPSITLLDGGAGATFDGRNPSVVVVPLLSKGFALDIPLLQDVDNAVNPLLYLAAAPYATGAWPGATIFEGVDGEYSTEVGSFASTAGAVWGYATGVLGTANPNLWDRISTVNVRLQTGTLTGTTEAAIDAAPGRNLALIGDELVNFTTATLETDGSYTLSGFKRGRRGTEWAVGTHAARDVFLLLDRTARHEMGLSDVGTSLSFKAITSGRSAGGAFPIPVAFTGASLKPYAPVHLAGVKDAGSGDWALSWIRRSRTGGAWTSGTSVPLGEVSEEYEVEIMNGATVVRTVTGLTSPAFTWTAAMQTSDFGSGQSAVSFRVYQISDAVGRGFRASATV